MPALEDFAPAVDIADVVVERLDALLEPGPQVVPFGGGEDARQHVERDQAFLGVGFAIDREGDADPAEQQFRLAPALVEHVVGNLPEPVRQLAVGRTQRPVGTFHLVERDRHGSPGRGPRHSRDLTRSVCLVSLPGSLSASYAPTQEGNGRALPADPAGPLPSF